MLTSQKVYKEFYDNISLSGTYTKNWIVNSLAFNSIGGLWGMTKTEWISAKFITTIMLSQGGNISMHSSWDDGWNLFFDDIQYDNNFGNNAAGKNFIVNVEANKYYSLYVEWSQKTGGLAFDLTTITGSTSTSFSLPTLVSSSPFTTNIVASVWGDRFRTGSEEWDDGDTNNGNGWQNDWTIKSGYSCYGGNITTTDVWQKWGNGFKPSNLGPTAWDDNNTVSGDGCSSTCVIEAGWRWNPNSDSSKDICTEICGDGLKMSSSLNSWDDGNNLNGDGWSSSCTVEAGWTWSGGSSTHKDTCTEIWGDGIRFNSNSTYWDDGNYINGDGWDSSCNTESGWTWVGGNLIHKDTWIEICGDGMIFNSNSTYCDDGNSSDGDGWTSSWSIENGWIWSGGSTSTSTKWKEIWGDGIRFNSNSSYCDDGNNINDDGWDSICKVESNWKCFGGNSTHKDEWEEVIYKGTEILLYC